MPVKDTGTEKLIKDTAKRIFFAEGKLHATTQDIADAAGVNRAALHYYFRSRDQLVSTVFQEAMQGLSSRLGSVMASSKPFKIKVEQLIDVFLTEMTAYPYQETFMITEINTIGHQLIDGINVNPTKAFLAEVAEEMEKGTISRMNPAHFLINLFSLLSYPLIMAPIYRQLLQQADIDFDKLISERKEVICKMIFHFN
ncbi:MAG: TetR/AcrR family transcriptional regulator [Mucilaginibacter sp.]